MERLIVIAKLREGEEAAAESLIEVGPPFVPSTYGIERHSVHIGGGVVVFVFEGHGVEWAVEELVNDPVLAASFGVWAPLLESRPAIAHERFAWVRDDAV